MDISRICIYFENGTNFVLIIFCLMSQRTIQSNLTFFRKFPTLNAVKVDKNMAILLHFQDGCKIFDHFHKISTIFTKVPVLKFLRYFKQDISNHFQHLKWLWCFKDFYNIETLLIIFLCFSILFWRFHFIFFFVFRWVFFTISHDASNNLKHLDDWFNEIFLYRGKIGISSLILYKTNKFTEVRTYLNNSIFFLNFMKWKWNLASCMLISSDITSYLRKRCGFGLPFYKFSKVWKHTFWRRLCKNSHLAKFAIF